MSINDNEKAYSIFRALANTKRLRVVCELQDKEMCVGEISRQLLIKQANISQHLLILRKSKLVSARKIGKNIYYSLNHPEILDAVNLLIKGTKERW